MKSASAVPNPNSSPVIKEAVDLTLRAIENRTRFYRNLVVAVVALSIAMILLSIIRLSWAPIAGLLLNVPLVGAFLFLDGRQVRRWQGTIIEMWQWRGLNLGEFERVMLSLRYVPATSLKGLLAMLPKESAEFKLNQLSDEEKASLNSRMEAQSRRDQRRTLLGIFTLLLVISLLASALYFRHFTLLLCLAVSTLIWAVVKKVV